MAVIDKIVKLSHLGVFRDELLKLFVRKETGKGLSTNDFTTAEKEKLAGIAEGSNKYTLPTASSTVLGGVKIGSNVQIKDGTISVDLSGKVDKVAGKALSTNDYTTEEKNKLAGIATGANNYALPTASSTVLGGVKVGANLTMTNGVLAAVQGKVDLTPYAKTTDVSSTYETKSDATAKETALNNAIALKANAADLANYAKKSDISTVYKSCGTVKTYADLPTTGQRIGDVYNIETADATHEIDAGDNVVWDGNTWDNLGGFVDMSRYMAKSEYPFATDAEITALFANI